MDLREISIFKNLSDNEIDFIKKKSMIEEKVFSKDSHIFKVGEITNDFYYLIEGNIIVYKIDPNGKRFIIQNFNKSVIFGEVYAYLKEPFDFSAVAEEESRVLIVRNFRNIFMEDVPRKFLTNYINLISRKCLQLSKKNQITSQYTLRQKIANYILLNEDKGIAKIDISREERADSLATTRPSLSRELSKMQEDKLIEINDKTIIVLDGLKLKNII